MKMGFLSKTGNMYSLDDGQWEFPYTEKYVKHWLLESPVEDGEAYEMVVIEGRWPEAERMVDWMLNEVYDLNGIICDLENEVYVLKDGQDG